MTLKEKLNYYGAKKEPFFFTISYDLSSWDVISLSKLPDDILYSIDDNIKEEHNLNLSKEFITKDSYKNKFDKVINEIKNGNTYLLNLTTKTILKNKLDFKDIFINSSAKYKLMYKDKFISFSPETFIKISDNKINTFPMKGTIDANIKDAKNKILNDKKELAEHIMIVDLMRNDLNIVASNIKVDDFRYIDKIKAGEKQLLQVSSHISGDLKADWNKNIGDILIPLLPAGSITGTPKKKTVEIIKNIEEYNRDYFTGIWGIYDGKTLNSAILIRFIETLNNNFFYKSGGGITLDSDCDAEYNEMKDKVYIP
ncbi:MAG: aminodeoxychorismate synthase component I [Arcobacteraceae bacterium]|nr:aminodeoxychorismate synthase component I [Arcobacteraceae bacterium]